MDQIKAEDILLLDFVKNGPILFVGCHPDDIEYGCGGLLSKLKEKVPIYTLTLSKNQINPKHKNLIKEHVDSLTSLGIKKSNILVEDFVTREFSYSRQEICDYLWKINKDINPSCVFIPPYDIHQDHQVGHDECLRVFRTKTIIEYDIPRSVKEVKMVMFVELSKKNISEKINALSRYKTYKKKKYLKKDSILATSQSAGIKLEIPYCEIYSPISVIL
jgi:LmbE family N-acetylglucosaminyl deacetylase